MSGNLPLSKQSYRLSVIHPCNDLNLLNQNSLIPSGQRAFHFCIVWIQFFTFLTPIFTFYFCIRLSHLISPSSPSLLHLTSPHLTSPQLTSAHLTSSHLTSPHFTSPHLTSPHLTSPYLTSPHLTSPHLTSPHLTSPHLTSPHLTSPHLTSPHLTSPHLTSPHLTSPHLTSPHFTSPHLPYLTLPHFTSPHLTFLTSPYLTAPHLLISPHRTSLHVTSPNIMFILHLRNPIPKPCRLLIMWNTVHQLIHSLHCTLLCPVLSIFSLSFFTSFALFHLSPFQSACLS